jgi:calcineurin-like phosphoesterase family protein
MSQIYFTSDTHFGHGNIAGKNTSKWKEGYRDYNSVEEMNQDMVKAINKSVKEDDILYHIGDWSFGGIENIWRFRKQLRCQNIHLILGNHDHHIEENKLLPNVHYGPYNNDLVDGPNPNTYEDGRRQTTYDVYAKGLFKSVSHYKEVTLNGKVFILSHYGHRVWHGSHKGWIHLYGHSHDSLPPYGKSHDVGVDTALRLFGTPRPFSVTDILDIMNKQPLEFPDHHDLSTNTGKPQGARQR